MTEGLYWMVLSAVATLLMSLPYVFESILRVGLPSALGYSKDHTSGGFERPGETPAAWAARAYRAHRNALESLPVLAVFVLTAHVALSGANLANVALAAKVYFFARLAHFVVYTAGIPVLRTLSFFAALGALLFMAYTLLRATV
jgi:uncharacterized MAPEG superfamily protein